MSDVIPFEFETRAIRVVMRDGEPWWVLADVARALEYRMASDAARLLDADERGTQQMRTPSGEQEMLIISEPGVYRLLARSDKPVAKRFQRWLFHDVLPSIRKTGSYHAGKEKLPTNFDAIRALVDAAEEHEMRIKRVENAVENLGAHEDFRSIKAHAALIGVRLSTQRAAELGRQATAVSRQLGTKIGKQPDDAFGMVNTYHRDVLAIVFGEADK